MPRPQARAYNGVVNLADPLAAWGDFDRDDPYPLFADVRARGPVHAVTLADGHDAWAVVAEGLPGPALARHMLAVDPPDHTRLRRLVAGAFAVRRIESLAPTVTALVDELLDAIEARGPDTVVDLVGAFA